MAPRAHGDSVRPRRPAGVGARPLNFTVRALMSRGQMTLIVLLPVVVWTAFVTLYLQQRLSGLLDFGLGFAGFSLTVPAVALILRLRSNTELRVADFGYFGWLWRGVLSGVLATIVYSAVMYFLSLNGMGPRGPLDALVVWLAFASFVCYSVAKRIQ